MTEVPTNKDGLEIKTEAPEFSTSTIGSAKFAAAEAQLPDEVKRQLAKMVDDVADRSAHWAQTSCSSRIELIDRTIETLGSAAGDWVAAACEARGLTSGTSLPGEEWLAGPSIVARNLRLLRSSLQDIERTGCPRLPSQPTTGENGQVLARVAPVDTFDNILYRGFTAEIWMQPEVTLAELPGTMAVAYQNRDELGSVCLVLGAGNVSSIGPTDAFYKLFVENQVVVLKMNPVNEYLAEFYERALAPMIAAGILRIVTGGTETGQLLCNHPGIDCIHITGSDKTHDAIVYGTGPEGAERKQQRTPWNPRRVTSELGNVSPVIVVPGRWSQSDIAFQALNVASMLSNNAGFNCNAIRVLITHAEWDQRDEFLRALKATFAEIKPRRAYYPGAAERYAALTSTGRTTQIGPRTDNSLPWAIVEVPSGQDHACFSVEAFCSVMSSTAINADSVESYIDQAVEFANDRVWGTLSASLIVKPASLKQANIRHAVDRAVENMRFGTVGLNHWTGLGFGLVSPTWGAFPGHPQHDIRSGSGVVHNTFMFDKPQKSVIRGPFRVTPKPAWFATHAGTHRLGPALFRFESKPSWLRLPSVAIHALG